MYGCHDTYFNQRHPAFQNSVWIELIGFDHTLPDYGVADFLSKTGFVPDTVSMLLTSICFVLTHRTAEETYLLPKYACSYNGHDSNDDRKRQAWTNRQLQGLVQELHRHGIQVYVSFFDFEPDADAPESYLSRHPELRVVCRTPSSAASIHMLGSYADGTPFETVFIRQLQAVIRDYAFDGVQLADGVSSLRKPLQLVDYSAATTDRFFAESGISKPKDCTDTERTANFIFSHHRKEWIAFYRRHWSAFMDHVIQGIHEAGAKAAVNTAWTKGPVEALYRYGADYRAFAASGADAFVPEDVAADLFFLAHSDVRFEMGHDRRKFIHYEFAANLMQLRAQLPHTPLTPLCMIRDTLEQWDVLHHMPSAMQRAVAVNLSNFYIDSEGAYHPLTNGPHFCLGDGLKASDWDYIRQMWDNAYTPTVQEVTGVTVLWSDHKCEKELEALLDGRLWYNGKWVAELLAQGAAVHKITRPENLSKVKGPLLVINPFLLSQEEQTMIKNYGGEVLFLGLLDRQTIGYSGLPQTTLPYRPIHPSEDPHQGAWGASLDFSEVDPAFLKAVATHINRLSNLPQITEDFGACHINEIQTSPHTARLFLDNEEYWYATPVVRTHRRIRSLRYVTKPSCYPVQQPDEYSFRIRVPGFGTDIIEVTYED